MKHVLVRFSKIQSGMHKKSMFVLLLIKKLTQNPSEFFAIYTLKISMLS